MSLAIPQQSCGTGKRQPNWVLSFFKTYQDLAVMVWASASQKEEKQQKLGGRFNSFYPKGSNPPPHIAPSQRGATWWGDNS